MRASTFLSLVLVFAWLPGCDGGDGTDAGTARDTGMPRDAGSDSGRCTEFTPEYCPRMYPMTPIPASEVCEAFVDAFCRANGLCCSDESRVYSSFDACETDQLRRCHDMDNGFEFASFISALTIRYNQGAAGGIFANLATMGDMCVPIRYGDEILDIYAGEIARGNECTRSVQCADNGFCLDSGGIATCVGAPQRLDICGTNAECSHSDLRCNESNECDFRLAIDEPCGQNDDCETLFCRSGFCFEATPDATYCVDITEPGPAFE